MSNKRKNKKKKKQRNLLTDLQKFFADGLGLIVTGYMVAVIGIMPFYFTNGYVSIGTDKHTFLYESFRIAGMIFGSVLPLYLGFGLGRVLKEKRTLAEHLKGIIKKLSLTDWFALGYGMAVVVSYLLSKYKEPGEYGDALYGANKWYMGTLTQLMFVAVYFAVSRFWKGKKWVLALWIPVTCAVFFLAYLNRFQIYPIEMKNANPHFISTIGNINWYCGYLVIVFFGIMTYIILQTRKNRGMNGVWGIWLVLGFATLLTQGSFSGIVTLLVVLWGLYLYLMRDKKYLFSYFLTLSAMGVAGILTYILRRCYPGAYNYEDPIVDVWMNSPLIFVVSGVILFMVVLVKVTEKKNINSEKFFVVLGYLLSAGLLGGLLLFTVLGIKNTLHPGSIGALSANPLFTFDLGWGSNRIATWKAGWMCFVSQDLRGKLFGVGPDCMSSYIMTGENQELLQMVSVVFDGLILTNTHCELLTVLVNTGLLGLISYGGLLLSNMIRCLKVGKTNAYSGACGFAIFAYMINNLFSFSQSLNGITIFLVLGMGEVFLKQEEETGCSE